MHARGIVHHGIKPANILIPGPDGRITGETKLTAFGIATSSVLPCTSSGYGTAHYMSPEQAAGAGAGAPGDIYALGLVVFECPTGTRPFPASPLPSMLARTLRPPRIPDTRGPPVDQVHCGSDGRWPAEQATARPALRPLRRVRSASPPRPIL
jgi:serine/threonine protein kinase